MRAICLHETMNFISWLSKYGNIELLADAGKFDNIVNKTVSWQDATDTVGCYNNHHQ